MVYEAGTGKGQETPEVNYVPYLGAGVWLGVVAKGSPHAEAAFDLLAELSGDEVSRRIVIEPEWGGGVFRDYQLTDSRSWSSFNLDQEQTNSLLQSLTQTLLHPGLVNPAICLRIPAAREHSQVLVAELRNALNASKDAATALKNVENRWREIDNRTPGRIRADYAYSLGLVPPP